MQRRVWYQVSNQICSYVVGTLNSKRDLSISGCRVELDGTRNSLVLQRQIRNACLLIFLRVWSIWLVLVLQRHCHNKGILWLLWWSAIISKRNLDEIRSLSRRVFQRRKGKTIVLVVENWKSDCFSKVHPHCPGVVVWVRNLGKAEINEAVHWSINTWNCRGKGWRARVW